MTRWLPLYACVALGLAVALTWAWKTLWGLYSDVWEVLRAG